MPVRFRLPLFLGAALFAACAGSKAEEKPSHGTADEQQGIKEKQEGNLTVKMYDLFHSGHADVWEYYEPITGPDGKPAQRLVRKEMDLNDDGKVVVWRWYNDKEQVIKEALDLDFDGKVDEIIYFDERGEPIKKELALDFKGKPNTWKYYEKGKLVRVERDTKGTGKVDTWEYWEGGKVDRIGIDTDGDGVVDQWVKKTGS